MRPGFRIHRADGAIVLPLPYAMADDTVIHMKAHSISIGVMKRFIVSTLVLVQLVAGAGQAFSQVPRRIVMGGKAVIMVADVVYAFPSARSSVLTVGGADQGLGFFLGAVSPAFNGLPTLDRQAGVEAYAAFNPDMVILKSSLKKTTGAGLEALGIRTAYLTLETVQDFRVDLQFLGRMFGDEARARELVAYYDEVSARVDKAVRGSPKPRVLLIQASGDGYQIPPDGWMQTSLVEMAGGVPVWKGASVGSGWARVGAEQIAAWNPDVILVVSYSKPSDEVALLAARDQRIVATRAAKDGAVIGFAQDFISWDQPDVRWGLGLLWLADVLHPGRLPGFDAVKEARTFFRLFYQIDDTAFDRHILPRLRVSGR